MANVSLDGTDADERSARTMLAPKRLYCLNFCGIVRRDAAAVRLDEVDRRERRARAIPLAFLTLEVRAGNAPAIALYASLGYETVGRRRNYYEKPIEDALLMTRVLTAPNSEKNEEETR